MRAAVWRLDRDARLFKCRCAGECGPLTTKTPGVQRDDDGKLYIPGYLISSTMTGHAAEERWYECPMKALNAPWLGRVFRWWRITKGDLAGLCSMMRPSAALVDLWDTLACEMAELRAAIREREIEAAKSAGRR